MWHLDLFIFLGFDVFLLITMYGAQVSTAAATAGSTPVGAAAPAGPDREKLESRFKWLLASADVSDAIQDALGKLGVVSLALFRHFAKDEDKLRNILKKDPFKLDEDADALQALEVARLVGVYESAKETIAIENKHRAERLHQDLPPKLNPGDLQFLVKLFEKAEYELDEVQTPSEAFLERKIHELETRFVAEPLTRVTNFSQADVNDSRNMSWDHVNSKFVEKGKVFTVPMPRTPETLRARIKTLGTCWHFLRLKSPGRAEVRTADIKVFDLYTTWLFGPKVWGYSTDGSDGKPISTPHLDHVLLYDIAIRKKVADLMNEGKDLKQAFAEATADDRLMQRAFLNHVMLDSGTEKCKRCTAPGLAETHVSLVSTSEGAASKRSGDEAHLSKNQLDRIKKKARREAAAAAGLSPSQLLAIQNGPPPAKGGAQRPPGQGLSKTAKKRARDAAAKAANGAPAPRALPAIMNGGVGDAPGGKAKGKGKGNGACYGWNDGNCTRNPCPFKHICSKCGSADHKRPQCTQ